MKSNTWLGRSSAESRYGLVKRGRVLGSGSALNLLARYRVAKVHSNNPMQFRVHYPPNSYQKLLSSVRWSTVEK